METCEQHAAMIASGEARGLCPLCQQAQLAQIRADAAKLVRAVDASAQLIEALIAWLPEGMGLPENTSAAYGAWKSAMKEVLR
jgi:hypothetical protein